MLFSAIAPGVVGVVAGVPGVARAPAAWCRVGVGGGHSDGDTSSTSRILFYRLVAIHLEMAKYALPNPVAKPPAAEAIFQ